VQGIEATIEVFPLADLSTAFEKMVHGKVRFRSVVRVTES
jgi:D-arabinose 1-dehydrogenase-like Zn-dependent alcohol dehydrogenase